MKSAGRPFSIDLLDAERILTLTSPRSSMNVAGPFRATARCSAASWTILQGPRNKPDACSSTRPAWSAG